MYVFNSEGRQESGYHTLNFIAIDLQLYKIFVIMRVSFLGHIIDFKIAMFVGV